jgi:hypothetical protein
MCFLWFKISLSQSCWLRIFWMHEAFRPYSVHNLQIFLRGMFVLYFTSVRSKLEYASEVWNSITSTDANKLEPIQQKFASVCFYRFLPHVPYIYTNDLAKLNLQTSRKRRQDLMHFFFFRYVVVLNPARPFWIILVFVFLTAVFGTSNCLVFVPLINTVLLGAPMLPSRWVKISTYLQSEPFL